MSSVVLDGQLMIKDWYSAMKLHATIIMAENFFLHD